MPYPRDAPLPRAEPAEVGVSAHGLRRLDDALRDEIDRRLIPGAVLGVARRGRVAHLATYGYRDAAAEVPMTLDTLFWAASMTKPLTVATAMTLVEGGAIALDDPVTAHLPELAGLEVGEAVGADLRRVPLARPLTLRHLATHTAGMVEGFLEGSPVHRLYAEAFGNGMTDLDGAEFLARIARLPLFNQPGALWHYGFGIDVLGLLLERVSGGPLRDLMARRLLLPLGMEDTGFGLRPADTERYARPLAIDPDTGAPQALPDLGRARFDSGGAGAVTTAGDYLRFAAMLVAGGALGDATVLRPGSVAEMTRDQLGPGVDVSRIGGDEPTLAGYGFGLGVAVRRDGHAALAGTPGDYTWAGAGGTYWWADPRRELAVVLMTHTPALPARRRHRELVRRLVLAALID